METVSSNLCSECKHTFKGFSNLRKHVKKFHPSRLEELAPLKVKSYPFQCTVCQKNFSDKKNFNSHLKIHLTTVDSENGNVPVHDKNDDSNNIILSSKNIRKKCPLCDYMERCKVDFIKHFKQTHKINIDTENLQFSSSEDFNVWFSKTEKDTQTKFILETRSVTAGKIYVSYICHRSGFFKSRSSGKRHLKTKGSKKINGYCPAGLQVFIEKESGIHNVTFAKTHVGHQNDLCHLFLTKDERAMIATKIAMNIPFNVILDNIRDSATTSDLERLQLLTKKDLFNIAASFNLHTSAQTHNNDAFSVTESNKILEIQQPNLDTNIHIKIKSLDDKKRDLIEKITYDLNNIESEREFLAAEKVLATLEPTLKAVRQETEVLIGQVEQRKTIPSNKKIEQQKRLLSAGRKNSKNKRLQKRDEKEQ